MPTRASLTPTLSSRLRELVDRYYGGSVNAAAKAVRIPQATLARLVDGRVQSPRAALLQRLAAFHHVSVDWLLGGDTGGPDDTDHTFYQGLAESLRWSDLVLNELKLWEKHPQLSTDLLDLPTATGQAAHLFNVTALGGHPTRKRKVGQTEYTERRGLAPGFLAATRQELAAWLAFMEEWIMRAGIEQVRAALIKHESHIRERFVNVPRFE